MLFSGRFLFLERFFGQVICTLKAGLYGIWCDVHTLGDSSVHTLGDTSAFVNPAGQLLLTWRGKTRMDGVGIVFEFYIAHLCESALKCVHICLSKK